MTDIICKWLNDDLNLSQPIDSSNIGQFFSNGYLFGEILHKHGLQDDFDQFSHNKTSNSKLNNFMRLQPTIKLLDIKFSTNTAREIMQEKSTTTTQLLYQMYIALTNKEKRNLTGTAMETMRPAAPVRLEHFESKIYQKTLKAKTPRQTELNLAALRARYDKFKAEQEKIAFEHKFLQQENSKMEQQMKRIYLLNKSKEFKQQQAELFARIKSSVRDDDELNFTIEDSKNYKHNLAAVVQIPKTPPHFKKEAILERRRLFEKDEGEKALKEIELFETKFLSKNKSQHDNNLTIVDLEEARGYDDLNDKQGQLDPVELIKPTSNEDYIYKIRSRLQEDAHARKEREKRRRKVLVDQLKANDALEEFKREEALVARLLRQSQFERRIAVELLHARHEKDVIRDNRIAKEREILERREKEFIDALDRERELARLAKLEYLEQLKKDKEWHDLIQADKAAAKYKKHYEMCEEITSQLFEFAYKVAEYRELTDNLIPPKIWRDWVNLFRAGKLTDNREEKQTDNLKEIDKIFNIDSVTMGEDTHRLLDNCDFNEYKEAIGEWEPDEKFKNESIETENKIVGFIVNKLQELCYPAPPGAPRPVYPEFPLKVCVIGKPFSGKTSSLKIVEQVYGINVLYPQELIIEAIEEYKKNPDLTAIDEIALSSSENFSDKSQEQPIETTPVNRQSAKPKESSTAKNTRKTRGKDSTAHGHQKEIQKVIENHELQAANQQPLKTSQNSFYNSMSSIDQNRQTNLLIRRLGSLALKSLENGEAIPDEIVVHIITEKIKTLHNDKGWILDGFPCTYNQTKLLEKALTGYDVDKPALERPKMESILAPNPKPQTEKPKHKSGIDLCLYLDISDEMAIQRSIGRFAGSITNNTYHIDFNPPPEGAYSGLNRVETVTSVKDDSNDTEQLQNRLNIFENEWKSVETFYQEYSNLKVVKLANSDKNETAEVLQNEIENFVNLREKKRLEELEHKRILEHLIREKQREEAELLAKQQAEAEAEKAAAEEAQRQLEAKKAQEALEKAPIKSPKGKKGGKDAKGTRSKSPKSGKSPEKEKSQSPKGSKKSASPKGGKQKAAVTPVPPPETQLVPVQTVRQTDSPQPGTNDYVYVNEKIDLRMAKIICDHWDVVENSYISGTKFMFRKIRKEREQIIRYFFTVKSNFVNYLSRPDTKQIELESFIKEYNSIPDDMRDDEEVKAELHQRVEDLRDNLYRICDMKKEESEKERELIMNNGWLPDKIGFLTNHFITLMQCEMDRFQDTARLLKDYYKSMQSPQPDEWAKEYPKLPLIDLRNPDEMVISLNEITESSEKISNDSNMSSDGKTTPKSPKQPKSPRTKSPKSPKSKSPSGSKKAPAAAAAAPIPPLPTSKKGKRTPDLDENGKKFKIPLIPRTPTSQELKDPKKVKPKGKGNEDASPPPPEDPDERLLHDAYKNACSQVNTIVSAEVAQLSVDETTPKDGQPVEDASKQKGGKKSAKSRSPSAKKKPEGSKSPKGKAKGKAGAKEEITPQAVTVELTEEEKAKKSAKDKIKKEYLAALKNEEALFRWRVELIKAKANHMIQDVKTKADNTYKEMNDKLGDRFIRENTSISNLCNYIKFNIENKQKIKRELMLDQDEFVINDDIIVLRTPSPPPRPDPVEHISVEQFSVESLNKMLNQFKLVAPEGLVAVKTFVEIFNELILLNNGNDTLPEQWLNMNQNQIEALGKMVAAGSEFVDWRSWLLAASAPWPYPTQTQLLDQLKQYSSIDQTRSGFISRQAFLQTPLWFYIEKPQTPPDILIPHSYDRHTHLINFWFNLFSSKTPSLPNLVRQTSVKQTEDQLNYKNMLLYMCAVSDPYDGFLRALSISQEAPMPRIEPRVQMKAQSFNTPEYEQLKLNSATNEKFPDDQLVSIDALYRVFHHGERQRGDTHRFALTEDPEDFMSYQRISTIFAEINEEPSSVASYSKLIAHPVLCEMISICNKFRLPDFRTLFVLSDDNETIIQDQI